MFQRPIPSMLVMQLEIIKDFYRKLIFHKPGNIFQFSFGMGVVEQRENARGVPSSRYAELCRAMTDLCPSVVAEIQVPHYLFRLENESAVEKFKSSAERVLSHPAWTRPNAQDEPEPAKFKATTRPPSPNQR